VQLSIDEAARRCTERQNWNGHWTRENRKWRVHLSAVLKEILNKLSNGRKLSPRWNFFGQIGSLIFENDKFFKPRSETFAGMHSSIKWQPVLEQYSAEKKNPAVAAAGRMTRKSFRRLVQEETVSEGESTRLGVRVSTPLARYVRSVG
jgi:hypothetical protein